MAHVLADARRVSIYRGQKRRPTIRWRFSTSGRVQLQSQVNGAWGAEEAGAIGHQAHKWSQRTCLAGGPQPRRGQAVWRRRTELLAPVHTDDAAASKPPRSPRALPSRSAARRTSIPTTRWEHSELRSSPEGLVWADDRLGPWAEVTRRHCGRTAVAECWTQRGPQAPDPHRHWRRCHMEEGVRGTGGITVSYPWAGVQTSTRRPIWRQQQGQVLQQGIQ